MGRRRKSRPGGAQDNTASVPPEYSPGKKSEPKELTPYQGKRRSFGHFHCPKCKKEWTSAYSLANTYQMCKNCNTFVYPNRQESEPKKLTPYQGKRRSFGHFHCPKCKREWTSAYSSANTCQQCRTCNTAVYPYGEGNKRMFGDYRCPKCKKEWVSANSWANEYQKCKTCKTAVYPYKQNELLEGLGSGQRSPHPRNLCQRCIETGLPCWESTNRGVKIGQRR